MRVEHALCERTGFEQREAEQHCIAHARPDGVADVVADRDIADQGSVYRRSMPYRQLDPRSANRPHADLRRFPYPVYR